MKLPNAELALVSKRKITEYLLSDRHPSGKSKSRFFRDFLFSPAQWEVMANALKSHAIRYDIVRNEKSPFGQRFVIEGLLETPGGKQVNVRTVWFIESGEEIPHFVTAVPLKKSSDS